MPKTWYDFYSNRIDYDNDSSEEIEKKRFYQSICAYKKPYFFMYNYLSLKSEYDKYMTNVELKSCSMFHMSYKDLIKKEHKTKKEDQFIQWVQYKMPVDTSPSIMNRICWAVEEEIEKLKEVKTDRFDSSMIKSGYNYSHLTYKEIENLYKQYKKQISNFSKIKKSEYYLDDSASNDEGYEDINQLREQFSEKCVEICPNALELCDILIDLCYKGRNNKEIVWFVCGDTIIENLLKNNNQNMYYPQKVDENEEFWCAGHRFVMKKVKIGGENE